MMDRLTAAAIAADLRYLPGGGATRGFDRYAIFVEDAEFRRAVVISGYIAVDHDLDDETTESEAEITRVSASSYDDSKIDAEETTKVGFWLAILGATVALAALAFVVVIAFYESNR